MILDYYTRGKSIEGARKAWSSWIKTSAPTRHTYENLVKKFETSGSVYDDKESMKTKERTVRTPEIIDSAKGILDEDSTRSNRSIARDLDISQASVSRIKRTDLGLFPYKIQSFQNLESRDKEKRLEFANEMCEFIDRKKIDPRKILFTDEANFHLDGYVNRQNYRVWGTEKPSSRTKPLHPKRIAVWAGISSQGIIGPIFLKEKETVDRKTYNRILNEAISNARSKNMIGGFYWQQDGAPPHRTEENLAFVHDHYDSRVIAKGFPSNYGEGKEWPPYSPDFSPMDYYLWGSVKGKVYKKLPKDM